jgi:hypothetical protein
VLDDREGLGVLEHRGEAFVEAAGRRVLGGNAPPSPSNRRHAAAVGGWTGVGAPRRATAGSGMARAMSVTGPTQPASAAIEKPATTLTTDCPRRQRNGRRTSAA